MGLLNLATEPQGDPYLTLLNGTKTTGLMQGRVRNPPFSGDSVHDQVKVRFQWIYLLLP